MNPITSFHGEWYMLSNFYPARVMYDGEKYPSVEHAYQAAKTLNPEERIPIQCSSTPGRAKHLGRKVTLRPNWEQMKDDVMLELLGEKFFNNTDCRRLLLSTGTRKLLEGNTWGDMYWGMVRSPDGNLVGKNRLGILLMEVREWVRE